MLVLQTSSFLGKADSQTLIGSASLPRVQFLSLICTCHAHLSVQRGVLNLPMVRCVQLSNSQLILQVRELRTAQSSSPIDTLSQPFAKAKAQASMLQMPNRYYA